MELPIINIQGPDPSTLWQRIVDRLFPTLGLPAPTPEEMLGWAPNYATIITGAKLNWRERIRMLVSGRLKLVLQLRTDAPCARMATKIVCYPVPPEWALKSSKPVPLDPAVVKQIMLKSSKPVPLDPAVVKQIMDGREARRRVEIASPGGLRTMFPGLKAKK